MDVLFKYSDEAPNEVRCLIAENGAKSSKTVPVGEFLKIVTDVTPRRLLRIGSLPSGYIDGTISPDGHADWEVVTRLPGEVRPFAYKGKTYDIPMPDLVFRFKVQNGMKQKAWVCIAKGDKLYHYPFGNVYPGCEICFGNVHLGDLKQIKDAERLMAAFVGAETNDDLYQGVVSKVGRKNITLDQRQLLELLNGKDEWPSSVKLKGVFFNGGAQSTIKDLCDFKTEYYG